MMAPVRVMRLTPHFYYPQPAARGGWSVRYDPIGGMQSQIYSQTRALSSLGVEQTVLTLGLPNAPRTWQLDERTDVRGIALPLLPFRSELRGTVGLNVSWAGGVAAWSLRHGRARGYDIVHTHGSGVLWPLVMGPLAARACGARLVVTVHCSTLATYHAMSRLDAGLKPIAEACERRVLAMADHVVVLTEHTRRVYDGLVAPEKLSVIADALDARAFAAPATPDAVAAFAARHRIPRDKRVVAFVGRIAIEKGWPAFVDAATRLEDAHFLVCGDGNQRRRLEARIDELGLRERFTVTGFVPREDVACAFALASVFVLPSLHEEFGSSVLEAAAMGVPIVATNVGGVPEHIRDGEDGLLVPPGSPDAIAEAVRRIFDDAALARRLTEGARRTAEAYSMEPAARAMARVYSSLAGR